MKNKKVFGKKYVLIAFLLGLLFFTVGQASNNASTVVFSDNTDDVMQIDWSNDKPNTGIYQTVSDQPDYDIVGVDYKLSLDGDAILSLSVKGTIQYKDTYYWIKILDVNNNYQIDAWYGLGRSGAELGSNLAVFQYFNGSSLSTGNISYNAAGSQLTLILSKTFTGVENKTISFPNHALDNWEWHVSAWHGSDIGTNNGTWYLDYAPESDNKYTEFLTPYGVFGFEFIPLLMTGLALYFYKKRK